MEELILGELQTIKLIAIAILILTFVCAVILVVGFITNLRSVDALKREAFVSEAKGLEDRGDYEQLAIISRERTQNYPKDIVAWFYLAIARLRNNNYQGALEAFSEVQSIDPFWEKEVIQEYLESVRDSMDGPKK